MGLLETKKEIEKALEFFTIDYDKKVLAAYISDSDGTLHMYNEKFQTKEECKTMCQWYLNIVDKL